MKLSTYPHPLIVIYLIYKEFKRGHFRDITKVIGTGKTVVSCIY